MEQLVKKRRKRSSESGETRHIPRTALPVVDLILELDKQIKERNAANISTEIQKALELDRVKKMLNLTDAA